MALMLSASQSVVYRQPKPDLFAEVKLNRGNIFLMLFERKGAGKKLAMQLLWNKRARTVSPRSGLVVRLRRRRCSGVKVPVRFKSTNL